MAARWPRLKAILLGVIAICFCWLGAGGGRAQPGRVAAVAVQLPLNSARWGPLPAQRPPPAAAPVPLQVPAQHAAEPEAQSWAPESLFSAQLVAGYGAVAAALAAGLAGLARVARQAPAWSAPLLNATSTLQPATATAEETGAELRTLTPPRSPRSPLTPPPSSPNPHRWGYRVQLLGRQFDAEPMHATFGVRVHGAPLKELLEEDSEQLCADIRAALARHKLVVFGDQQDVDPTLHVAICRGLGGGGDCLDEKFSANHDDGLEGMHEVQYVSERDAEAVRPSSEAYNRLPPAVWPISNNPAYGTVNAGDGGFHTDGAWFGEHFRYMSFFCRAQLATGGETLFASSNAMLSRLEPEELDFLRGVFVEYTDKMVYPGGNSINPSGRMTIIPLISLLDGGARSQNAIDGDRNTRGIDPALTVSAFLDPKYWRRVYVSDAAREHAPSARARFLERPFWDELIGDNSPARRAKKSALEISGGVVDELPWDEALKVLEIFNERLGPGGAWFDELTLPVRWREHDLGLYCNRSLVHRAHASTQKREGDELRLIHRISIKGPYTPHFYIEKEGAPDAA